MFNWMKRHTLRDKLQGELRQCEFDLETAEQRRDDAEVHAQMYTNRAARLVYKISCLEEQSRPAEAVDWTAPEAAPASGELSASERVALASQQSAFANRAYHWKAVQGC